MRKQQSCRLHLVSSLTSYSDAPKSASLSSGVLLSMSSYSSPLRTKVAGSGDLLRSQRLPHSSSPIVRSSMHDSLRLSRPRPCFGASRKPHVSRRLFLAYPHTTRFYEHNIPTTEKMTHLTEHSIISASGDKFAVQSRNRKSCHLGLPSSLVFNLPRPR